MITVRTARHFIAAVFVTALAGCSTGAGSAAPAATVTTTRPAPAETTRKPITQEDKQEDKEPTPAVKKAVKKTLPNVVGMNLQKGQDTMQAAGFYVLNDKDATGQNRLQIFDRNWVVTRQTPAAGRKVPIDTLVTLYAKKIGE
ncbi:PASTA domain-containing protein [Streptosporangium sp. NPDC003464]